MNQKLRYATALLWGFLWVQSGSAQVLNAPEAAPNQTPPAGTTPWSAACASGSFNDYWANFTWSPPLVNADNEFVLELSDASGNFGSPVELARKADMNTTFDFHFQFTLPANTRGEGYRLRVRSTSPAQTSPASVAYPMYYLDVNSGITIRPQGQVDFGNGTAQVCDGNSITLDVTTSVDASHFQRISVRGTVAEGNMMISRINDFDKLYFEPVGNAVLFIYKDRPGVIGQIGNLLAEAGVNIDDMRNPHDPSGTNSLALMRITGNAECELIDKIAARIEALHASCIRF